MGIKGLIPFLEKASSKGNISQFSGQTVAIDAYCWLHKGAFSCADKLALGQPTDQYVIYCMKFINMLLANEIKPILVFDGCHLPAKKDTEIKRREQRNANRKKAAELIQMGQTAEGRNVLRRSLDVSHEMALNLIKSCHERNVDCIVAPYEADAQLAYLNISGIADVIITEDSDLTLFGCKKIFFKMDVMGNGLLVEQDRLHLAIGVRSEHFDMNKFRHMCILSGCDYLPSLPGIGLQKALKFIKKTAETNMDEALSKLPSYLNMQSLEVSKEYRDAFVRANVTFLHQMVFCPIQRKQVRLTAPTSDVTAEQLHHAGDAMESDLAWQLAIGNYDPMSLRKMHDYDPDRFVCNQNRKHSNSWKIEAVAKHRSIWSNDYKKGEVRPKQDKQSTIWPNTFGKKKVLKTTDVMHKLTPPKRNYDESVEITAVNMLDIYKTADSPAKRPCIGAVEPELESDASIATDQSKSPILNRKINVFSTNTSSQKTSPSLLDKGKRRMKVRNLSRFQPTVVDNTVLTQSKFFAKIEKTAMEAVDQYDEISSDGKPDMVVEISETSDKKVLQPDVDFRFEINRDNVTNGFNEQCLNGDETEFTTDNMDSGMERKTNCSNIDYIEESLCTSESESGKTLTEISNMVRVEDDSESTDCLLRTVRSNYDTVSSSSQNISEDSGLGIEEMKYTSKYSLFNWTNNQKHGAAAQAASRSIHNVMGASRKTTRLVRSDSIKKITAIKRSNSQNTVNQQSLLSSFGFQKKNSMQH